MHALAMSLLVSLLPDDGLPPLTDLHLLPPAAVCKDNLAFADRYGAWLAAEIDAAPASRKDALEQCRAPALALRHVWYCANRAHGAKSDYWIEDYWNVDLHTKRRHFLGEYRRLVGREKYYGRDFPPAVPVSYFRLID